MHTLLAALVLMVSQASGNRSYWGELLLEGPLSEVRLDCGLAGVAVLTLDLSDGEERALALPLPVDSPLGEAGLSSVPQPELTLSGTGSARWNGWTAAQPHAHYAALAPGLRARPRPPLRLESARVGLAGLAVLVLAAVATIATRRRPVVVLPLALGLGMLALALGERARSRLKGQPPTRVTELELSPPAGCRVATGEFVDPIGADRLEVRPERSPLLFELALEAGRLIGRARARDAAGAGRGLTVLRAFEPERWDPSRAARTLAESWTRDGAGRWRAHGRWEAGEPLPPEDAQAAGPPGWLAAGMPPGRGVLLGRLVDGGWLRAAGFDD